METAVAVDDLKTFAWVFLAGMIGLAIGAYFGADIVEYVVGRLHVFEVQGV